MEKRYKFNLDIAFLFLILVAVSILIFPSIKSVKFADSADEGYYFKYADFIERNGIGGFKTLFTDYLKDKKQYLYPNPLRIGNIFISAMWFKLFGNTFLSLAYLSFFSYLLFIVISYYFCHKFFDRGKAILLSFLVAFSPINMGMSRRALQESLTTLFLGLSIWLFLDMVHKDKGIFKKLIFMITFTFTILVKEASVLLIVPFLIYKFVYGIKFKERLKLSDLLFVSVYPILFVALAYFFLSDNLSQVIGIGKIILTSPKVNRYAFLYGSGPWFRYIVDYLLLSPWVLLLSIGYIFYLIRGLDKSDIKEVYFLIIVLTLFSLFNLFTKNIRYVMILDMPIRLFSLLMLYALVPVRSEKMKFAIVSSAILAICIVDFTVFYNIFIKKGLYDPVSTWLLGFRNIIPLK